MERLGQIIKKGYGVLKKAVGNSVVVFIFILTFVILNVGSLAVYDYYIRPELSGDVAIKQGDSTSDTNSKNEDCNVAGINLRGQLWTYYPDPEPVDMSDIVTADYVTYYINEAENDPSIKAIILEIDSGGGYPVAGEEIAHKLKDSKKPTVALIRQMGASAAYWAATGAGTIFASKNSDVGSIGVTFSYLDNVSKNQKEGLNYVGLYSGKYKDMMNPDKPLTTEEKDLIMRDLKIVHSNFIKAVAENRNLSVDKVTALADGSSVLGEQAKNLGLIDKIGDLIDVKSYLTEKLGEEAVICWN